jgi:hypothetical protein
MAYGGLRGRLRRRLRSLETKWIDPIAKLWKIIQSAWWRDWHREPYGLRRLQWLDRRSEWDLLWQTIGKRVLVARDALSPAIGRWIKW